MAPYDFLPPENFLGLDAAHTAYQASRVVVVPIPFESTVSYMGGTKNGPRAILQASMQVELYDRDFGRQPALEYGVHTLPYLALAHGNIESALESIAAVTAEHARAGKLVVGLGGEHTVSVGFGRGLAAVYGAPVLTVQIDAHADLRDEFEGSPYSHACVARRLLDLGPVVQLGIRSLSQEEAELIDATPSDTLRVFFADEIHAGRAHLAELAERVRDRTVFLTIDVDGFDPAYVPATGTPEPDGLSWLQVLDIVRTVARNARVVGFDVVELAPQPGMHAADFLVAKLTYKTMSEIIAAGRL
ncbi:MAG: agmatinase [Anaerolineae bacterium]|nr:agmatinase [Thermoflexales bacterium]MDW8406289.1 agmatinase [Anaerolineae bacterium]